MAKSVAAKGAAKKKNRKLKRQIRKTVGALLMVSAIAVAAVPVPDISANPTTNNTTEKIKVAVTSEEGEIKPGVPEFEYASTVPYAQKRSASEQIVYTSGDGMFQFAYTQIDASNRGAVILNFNNVRSEDTIVIPETTEAYRKYSPNNTFSGYCLVSISDELLGYKTYEQKTNDAGQLLYYTVNYIPDATTGVVETKDDLVPANLFQEADGSYSYVYEQVQWKDETQTDKITVGGMKCKVEPLMGDVYRPCYFNQKSKWENLENEQLFYLPKKKDASGNIIGDDYGNDNWAPATESAHWKIEAQIAYIGSEKIVEDTVGWRVSGFREKPDEGVFANRSDITNLIFEGSIKGIGDYAFYHCWTLSSVEFKSGLETLGNGAFASCGQLQNVTIPRNAQVRAIGKDAFYDCQSLKTFVVPDGLQAIGDCAFENCIALESINLLGSGLPVSLEHLGNHLFRNCTSLSSVEFPNSYSETLDIDMFAGCTKLQFVKLPDTDSGSKLNFTEIHSKDTTTNYPDCQDSTWDNFRNTVPDSFYFEGPEDSEIHRTANDNFVTYKYPNQQLYERVKLEHDTRDAADAKPEGWTAKVIYQVNDSGDLVKFDMLDRKGGNTGDKSQPDIIAIPESVGAFGIQRIGEGSFNNNCYLTKVTIPASVTDIGANAFKGCHELRTVIFTDSTKIQSIGADAFRTQVTGCGDTLYPDGNKEKPKLYFVGAMLNSENADTETFKYAMNGTSKINHDNSDDIWITCHSGWPTNLEVQYYYDPRANEGEAQLVGYPRFDKLDTTTEAKDWAAKLPYVTNEPENSAAYYADMINRAVSFKKGVAITPPITPNEQAFLAATLNVAIPASVNSIKPGLFSGYDKEGNVVYEEDGTTKVGADKFIESILINGVDEIEPYTFKECEMLQTADIMGSTLLNDYAFDECESLNTVTIGSKLEDTGKRPFRKCEQLTQINCLEPSNFRYNKGVLYRVTGSGLEIVECLENRGKIPEITGPDALGSDELAGVTAIKPEAFQDCMELVSVDLSGTTVDVIPENCFKHTSLGDIILPSSLKEMHSGAFQDGDAKRLTVTYKGDGNVLRMDDDMFKQTIAGEAQQQVKFICPEGSNAYRYFKKYELIDSIKENNYIAWTDKGQEYTVRFWNLPNYPSKDNPIPFGAAQTVLAGEAAKLPEENPTCLSDPSLAFTGWDSELYKSVPHDLDIYPTFGEPEWTVVFRDGLDRNVTIGEAQKVKNGRYPQFPTEDMIPKHDRYMFAGWDPSLEELAPGGITKDTDIMATYILNDGTQFVITFVDYDGSVIGTQTVKAGENAMKPQAPTREGYTFVGWVPEKNLENVTENRTVMASYERGNGGANPNPSGGGGNNGPNPSGGNGNNNNNNNNNANSSASPRGSATAAPTATPANGNDVPKYTVTVSGGSGTGSYPAGAVVAINAYAMGVGQVFDKWTSSTAGVGFADATATSTTFTMPAANVAITATYKTGGAGSANTNASGGSGGGSSSGTVNNGSSVEVSRPGISNTNVAGATVTGATDNFVVKVSEDQAATDAATAALQARFGDLSRIKYFPMDISLYDSTGRTKIADTSGISVNLTLPLPDELIQYAGNNKMAAISGGALEDLNTRFTTVGGVPCINFTATHFSPYVIYVDTANLTEATIDSTPKTGDPIHPKWFLAIGMACISLVLFFKRDKVVIKSKAA